MAGVWSVLLMAGAAYAVHQERASQIAAIGAIPNLTWTAAPHPRFALHPPGASKNLCGVMDGWKERIQARIAAGTIERFVSAENVAVPEEFDSAENWPKCAKIIGDIRDQSNCGCCWAFAGAEAASDRMCIATDATLMLPLSAQDVCFCGSDDGCNGGFVEEPWDYIRLHGAVTGGQYHGTGPFGKGLCADYSLPHCHHHGPQGKDPFPAEGEPGCPKADSPKCPASCGAASSDTHSNFTADKYSFDGKVVAASGETDIQRMILAGGPVETAYTVFSDFENYAGGVYQHVTGEKAGGHAVKIVGWGVDGGVKYWKIANSWNPYWGEGGYFRILRGSNHCGIEDQVVATSADSKWHPGVTPSYACEDQETEEKCKALSCTWCYFKIFKMGFCKKHDFHCDSEALNTLVV
uniref:Peptidase C1A papain C-terminal domain-containing protein n=1 Tax=Pyrodinium bahamense TaxID=73915 RepID=A0A7S0FP37_9DINO|mmetsp:Transcript_41631/g.115921  ORF Transcript_41631/g.115921 Transcript_41631/m.115921 type:complete len:408 (+) Transcript_41631:75-1298(+)|eukprot:CAMPEP_0179043090 /NCGR_PEP_ID=MMETSP0796-20121207/16990_1 /TAXON_ID=73915 /ORGANISM="Pyrodinium bahamense, Strain pbaha01" /LENGTH=407 /DNA_ID=CAMNT_0020739469 /DNA_START=75 /DNA_END=1298 /DNA_ORIENTATION=-